MSSIASHAAAAAQDALPLPDPRLPAPPSGTKTIVEGSAVALYPGKDAVFYNPAQIMNRDLSVMVLRTYEQRRYIGLRPNLARRAWMRRNLRVPPQLQAERLAEAEAAEAAAAASGRSSPRDISARLPLPGLRVLEALAASGIRSVRYAKEVPNLATIVVNDFDPAAIGAIQANMAYNGLRTAVPLSTYSLLQQLTGGSAAAVPAAAGSSAAAVASSAAATGADSLLPANIGSGPVVVPSHGDAVMLMMLHRDIVTAEGEGQDGEGKASNSSSKEKSKPARATSAGAAGGSAAAAAGASSDAAEPAAKRSRPADGAGGDSEAASSSSSSSSSAWSGMPADESRGYVFQPFDVVDLDPYGFATPFLDSAVQSIADGGLLCVTCTDMTVLAGNHRDACHTKYGAVPVKAPHYGELAVRMVLAAVEAAAVRNRRAIVPLLSLSLDFYIRVFVQVRHSAREASLSPLKLGQLFQCSGCDAHWLWARGKWGSGASDGGARHEAEGEGPEFAASDDKRARRQRFAAQREARQAAAAAAAAGGIAGEATDAAAAAATGPAADVSEGAAVAATSASAAAAASSDNSIGHKRARPASAGAAATASTGASGDAGASPADAEGEEKESASGATPASPAVRPGLAAAIAARQYRTRFDSRARRPEGYERGRAHVGPNFMPPPLSPHLSAASGGVTPPIAAAMAKGAAAATAAAAGAAPVEAASSGSSGAGAGAGAGAGSASDDMGCSCPFCGRAVHQGGPIWIDPLHDGEFVGQLLGTMRSEWSAEGVGVPGQGQLPHPAGAGAASSAASAAASSSASASAAAFAPASPSFYYDLSRTQARPAWDGGSNAATSVAASRRRVLGLVAAAGEELPDVPLFYSLASLTSKMHAPTIPLAKVTGALAAAGYRLSGSHCAPGALKTDAPPAALWSMLTSWARLPGGANMPSSRYVDDAGTVTHHLLKRMAAAEAADPALAALRASWDFTGSRSAHAAKRAAGVRHLAAPTAGWGPQARASAAKAARMAAEATRSADADAQAAAPADADADADVDGADVAGSK